MEVATKLGEYTNTISSESQPDYPGDPDIERQLNNYIRWNAAMMVHTANKGQLNLGGHLSTYASCCDLFEVALNHILQGGELISDFVYFQGHASPGLYARAFLEGRLNPSDLKNFRQETNRPGLSSYPHPWLMPNFWRFPTVSMGLSPLMAVYQARYLNYLENRSILKSRKPNVWCFLGDGEMDEPESIAGLRIAARENLSHLTFVVNCNLQRLDGPVRGNGNIIKELEGVFAGCGWDVIKVIWDSNWDPLFEHEKAPLLQERLAQLNDGELLNLQVHDSEALRSTIFNTDELKIMLDDCVIDKKLGYGGHDYKKIFAAYQRSLASDRPSVILARTVKGYKLGDTIAGRNNTHQIKSFDQKKLFRLRDDFEIPLTDEEISDQPFFRPPADSRVTSYLLEHRKQLGGFLPSRSTDRLRLKNVDNLFESAPVQNLKEASTTKSFGTLLKHLLKNEEVGRYITPIIPDEARTFGLETLFHKYGIYSPKGQQYSPVDQEKLISYKELKSGQVLEEGITEAGAMATFIAAGTAYSHLKIPSIPFYIFYSMFGFQRVGDLIWAAGDARAKGFLLGATAGKTTLNGEGLQHQDGLSPLIASGYPTVKCYDPAYPHELAAIVQRGIEEMYVEDRPVIYYITLYNETYPIPEIKDIDTGKILTGLYQITDTKDPAAHILASGSSVPLALEARDILKEFDINATVWSVTSWSEIARACCDQERHEIYSLESHTSPNLLTKHFGDFSGPIIGVSDYVRNVPNQITPWMPATFYCLGTDGFGRSDTRDNLRQFFGISAKDIAFQTLFRLAQADNFSNSNLVNIHERWGLKSRLHDQVDKGERDVEASS